MDRISSAQLGLLLRASWRSTGLRVPWFPAGTGAARGLRVRPQLLEPPSFGPPRQFPFCKALPSSTPPLLLQPCCPVPSTAPPPAIPPPPGVPPSAVPPTYSSLTYGSLTCSSPHPQAPSWSSPICSPPTYSSLTYGSPTCSSPRLQTPHPPAAAQVDDVVDHAAGEVLLGHARQGGHQVPHSVAGRGQDVLRVAGVASVTGEESGHLWEHLGPWERKEGRVQGQ